MYAGLAWLYITMSAIKLSNAAQIKVEFALRRDCMRCVAYSVWLHTTREGTQTQPCIFISSQHTCDETINVLGSQSAPTCHTLVNDTHSSLPWKHPRCASCTTCCSHHLSHTSHLYKMTVRKRGEEGAGVVIMTTAHTCLRTSLGHGAGQGRHDHGRCSRCCREDGGS